MKRMVATIDAISSYFSAIDCDVLDAAALRNINSFDCNYFNTNDCDPGSFPLDFFAKIMKCEFF